MFYSSNIHNLYIFKMCTFCRSTLPTMASNVNKSWNVTLPVSSSQNSMNSGFLNTNPTRTQPQRFLWESCKNLHDCISTPVISGTSLSSTPTFQQILHPSIDFKLVSVSCYCYLCWWWCTNYSSNVIELQYSPLSNNTSVTTYIHQNLMIISPPCLFKHMKNDEHVAVLFQCPLDHTQQKLYFFLIYLLRNNVSKSVGINLRHSVLYRIIKLLMVSKLADRTNDTSSC